MHVADVPAPPGSASHSSVPVARAHERRHHGGGLREAFTRCLFHCIAAVVIAVLVLGYRFYGRLIARQFALAHSQDTPAHRQADGVDFVPTRPFYLFGQHFSAIAAAGPIVGPIESSAHVYHLFVITSPQRDALQAHLEKHGVQTQTHYPFPTHHQKPCHNLVRDPQGLRCSEHHASRCLSLPCHPQMRDDEVNKVIEVVNGFRQ